MIAIDTETTLATDEEPIPQLVSVAIDSGDGPRVFAAHEVAASLGAQIAFEQGAVLTNAPFDVFVLGRAFPFLWSTMINAYQHDRVHDVSTREKLLDIVEGQRYKRGRYSLAALAERLLEIDMDKGEDTWRKRYGELLGMEIADWPEDAIQYALDDAAITWRVWQHQEQRRALSGVDVLVNAGEQARKHLTLYAQTLRGIHTDPAHVEALATELDDRVDCSIAVLLANGLARVGGTKKKPKIVQNMKVAQDAMALWCERHDREPPRTATGVSLSDDSMRAAGVPDDHPLGVFRDLKALRSQITRLIPVLRHPVIRTRYDELVDSGRTSSSAPGDPWHGTNFQNLPTTGGYRECLVPPPGERLVISDVVGAELVTFAQVQLDVFGRSTLAEILRAGRNPHTEFACRIMDIRTDQYDPENPEHVKIRRVAKEWNFGKPGGMGDPKFQTQLRKRKIEMPLEEIRDYTRLWHETLPEVQMYFDWIKTQPQSVRILADGQQMTTYTIRQLRSNRIRGGCSYTEACNTTFQGLAADAFGTVLWWLWLEGRDPESPLFAGDQPTSQVLFVHDEPVSSVLAERAEAAAERQEQITTAAFAHWCPDVPITVESKIVERYCKA